MSAGLVVASTVPANAAPLAPVSAVQAATPAPSKVTVNKIKTAKVSKKTKTATVKPSVKSTGQAKVSSKKITVKKGKKTVAKNVSSAKHKAGKYTVTTTAKCKTWTNKTTTRTVTTLKLAFKKGSKIAVTCEFYYLSENTKPLSFVTGNPADTDTVDVHWVTSTCGGEFDTPFELEGIIAPATDRNIALDADGYYYWPPSIVPSGNAVVPVPENPGETVKLNVLAPINLYKLTKTVKKTTTKVWSKEKSKTLKQSLTVKK